VYLCDAHEGGFLKLWKIAIAALLLVCVLLVMALTLIGSDSFGLQLAVLLLILLLAIGGAVAMTLSAVFWNSPTNILSEYIRKNQRPAAPGSYDPLRYKLFRDAIDAVCIGINSAHIPLEIVEFPVPLAYAMAAADPSVLKHHRIPEHGVVVSRQFLQADFGPPEVEAVVADIMAKLRIKFEAMPIAGDTPIPLLAKKLQVSRELLEIVVKEFGSNPMPVQALMQDTWAARLINNPRALASAIMKSDSMLRTSPLPVRYSDPFVFVDPVYGASGKRLLDLQAGSAPELSYRLEMARARDRIIELRLENLRMIEHGMRQPGENVIAGAPVTGPKGWR